MKNYKRLSNKYEKQVQELLTNFRSSLADNCDYRDKEYALFYPSFGLSKDEPVDILIYGQAVNGWESKFKPSQDLPNDIVLKAAEFSNTLNVDTELSPLDWININWSKSSKKGADKKSVEEGYAAFRSFFWNVCYKLVSDYYKIDRKLPDWCKKMVWSNLMKIASAMGGNPDEVEWDKQLEDCKKLFHLELDELKPANAILLTNMEWAQVFVSDLDKDETPTDGNQVIQWTGTYNGTKVIVTSRPYVGNSDKWVEEILNHMQLPLRHNLA